MFQQQQQQQTVALDNSRILITSLLRHMASLSSSVSVIQVSDGLITSSHNDSAMLSQCGCSRASSSSSSSSDRHTSSADSGVILHHCSSISVINDVMSMTSDDSHAAVVSALVTFVKVCLFPVLVNRLPGTTSPEGPKLGRAGHYTLA